MVWDGYVGVPSLDKEFLQDRFGLTYRAAQNQIRGPFCLCNRSVSNKRWKRDTLCFGGSGLRECREAALWVGSVGSRSCE